jgi:hypothetical protein
VIFSLRLRPLCGALIRFAEAFGRSSEAVYSPCLANAIRAWVTACALSQPSDGPGGTRPQRGPQTHPGKYVARTFY